MSMEDLLESKKKIKKINSNSKARVRPVNVKKRKTFEDKYRRVTTYIERPLYREVQALFDSGKIRTKKDLYNSALEQYIKENY